MPRLVRKMKKAGFRFHLTLEATLHHIINSDENNSEELSRCWCNLIQDNARAKTRSMVRGRTCCVIVLLCSQSMTACMLEESRVGVVGVEVSVARQVMLPGGR